MSKGDRPRGSGTLGIERDRTEREDPRRLLVTSLAAGLVAVVAQSLIIRELVIAFLGNELVIGATLGAWLLWTGVGSATLGRWGERSKRPGRWVEVELALLAVLLPLCFLGTRHVRALAGLDVGEVAGPIPVLAACAVLLFPLCVVNGSIFPTLCRAVSACMPKDRAVARVYVWEAMGSAVGGGLFAAVGVRLAEPAAVVLVCCVVAVVLSVAAASRRGWGMWATRGAALAAGVVLSVLAFDRSEHVNTIYGRTSVSRREGTLSVFLNGVLAATYPPGGTAESLVHLAMLQVPRPQRVLLIGGLGGTAEDALQYPDVRVDIVELDPGSVRFVRGLHPPSPLLDAALASGRARLLFSDGRRHIRRYRGRPYDAVILSLPKPLTAQINRYYTVEFFRAARRVLSDGGVLAFRVESAPTIATPEVREFIACLRRTLRAAFEDVVVAPGDSNVFVAAKRKGQLTLDPDTLLRRLGERGVRPKRFDANVQGDLDVFRVEQLKAVLDESTSRRINTDLRPISYSQGLVVWQAKERTPRSGFFDRLVDMPLGWLNRFAEADAGVRWGVGLAVVGAGVVLMVWLRPGRGAAAGLAVGGSGFTEIAVEIVALLAFQALYGYVYVMLGLVLASFMVGLCAGGGCASRVIRRSRPYPWLLGAQAALAGYPLVLVGIIALAGKAGGGDWVAGAFLALTFVAGFVGGMQFPLAAAVASRGRGVAARLSAFDLSGAAMGAVVVSTFLLPTLGFVTLALLLCGIGLVALAGLWVARRAHAGA